MILFAYYLLKVMLCSGLLFLYYHLALRNKAFHQWNRFYLLAAIVMSLVIPIIKLNINPGSSNSIAEEIKILNVVYGADEYVAEIKSGGYNFSVEQFAIIIYCSVSAALLLLFVLALKRIHALVHSHDVMLLHDVKFVNTEEKDAPFSFFKFVFWNRQIELTTPAGEHIFQHELVHIREKHSFDKLCLQLILIGCWCNPFFWLIRKELRMIHEFIADKKSAGQTDAKAFATMILQAAYPKYFSHLTNQFFHSSIKRRLNMITKTQNPKISYLSRVVVLPLVAFILFAFSVKLKPVETNNTTVLNKQIIVVIDAGHGGGTGARDNNILEDELVLQLAKTIREANNNDQIKILLTRENDNVMGLKERLWFAKKNKADLFISLHMNAPSANSATTTERSNGYEITIPNEEAAYQKQSEVIGSALVQELSKTYTTYQSLVKRQMAIWVLDKNICPSVLIECGYISNKKDREFIIRKENQVLIAKKILKAIEVYAASPTTGKTFVNAQEVSKSANTDRESERSDRDTIVPKSMFFDTKNKIAIEFDEITHSINPEKSTVHLATAMLIVNGEKVPNDIFKRKTIITNKLKFIEAKEAMKTYGRNAVLGVVIFEGARYIDIPVTEYYKNIFNPKQKVKSDPGNKVFHKAEQEAEFPGGLEGWRRFLRKELNATVPNDNDAPVGSYTRRTKPSKSGFVPETNDHFCNRRGLIQV